ncbi:hypothetical protein QBC35DRAFT_526877 [Podospora australis]|uniref:Uncharacterized protein n=1 Tax=Podospora australis TaxID=1536484 RepID=A0AAN6X7M6_9PEZI|nr:hypothetical protein QBC35DRAFT_526877 [Podospora australis]
MENVPVFAKSPAAANKTSRLGIFATIRRKTSRIFVNKENTPAAAHQDRDISLPGSQSTSMGSASSPSTKRLNRRTWFNSLGSRNPYRHSVLLDSRFDVNDLTATTTRDSVPANVPPRSPMKRLLGTSSSMMVSLRGRVRHGSHSTDPEEHEHNRGDTPSVYSQDAASPVLTLPSACQPRADRRSSFQLGVQKAVQAFDHNFSLDDDGETSSVRKLPASRAIASNASEECLSIPTSTHVHPASSSKSTSQAWSITTPSRSNSEASPSTSKRDSSRTSLDSGKDFSNRTLPGSPVCRTCGNCTNNSQSFQIDKILSEMNQHRDEEVDTLIRDKKGALSLAAESRLVSQKPPVDIGVMPVDDGDKSTLSILEEDSSLVASTPKRSLRDELLRVGEISPMCGGDGSMVADESTLVTRS